MRAILENVRRQIAPRRHPVVDSRARTALERLERLPLLDPVGYREMVEESIMASSGIFTKRGRGVGPKIRRALERMAANDPLLLVIPNRRETQPSGLWLAMVCRYFQPWLDHIHQALRKDTRHLRLGGAPAWLAELIRPVRSQLAVSPARWPTIREAATRTIVARHLGLTPRAVQRKLQRAARKQTSVADSTSVMADGNYCEEEKTRRRKTFFAILADLERRNFRWNPRDELWEYVSRVLWGDLGENEVVVTVLLYGEQGPDGVTVFQWVSESSRVRGDVDPDLLKELTKRARAKALVFAPLVLPKSGRVKR